MEDAAQPTSVFNTSSSASSTSGMFVISPPARMLTPRTAVLSRQSSDVQQQTRGSGCGAGGEGGTEFPLDNAPLSSAATTPRRRPATFQSPSLQPTLATTTSPMTTAAATTTPTISTPRGGGSGSCTETVVPTMAIGGTTGGGTPRLLQRHHSYHQNNNTMHHNGLAYVEGAPVAGMPGAAGLVSGSSSQSSTPVQSPFLRMQRRPLKGVGKMNSNKYHEEKNELLSEDDEESGKEREEPRPITPKRALVEALIDLQVGQGSAALSALGVSQQEDQLLSPGECSVTSTRPGGRSTATTATPERYAPCTMSSSRQQPNPGQEESSKRNDDNEVDDEASPPFEFLRQETEAFSNEMPSLGSAGPPPEQLTTPPRHSRTPIKEGSSSNSDNKNKNSNGISFSGSPPPTEPDSGSGSGGPRNALAFSSSNRARSASWSAGSPPQVTPHDSSYDNTPIKEGKRRQRKLFSPEGGGSSVCDSPYRLSLTERNSGLAETLPPGYIRTPQKAASAFTLLRQAAVVSGLPDTSAPSEPVMVGPMCATFSSNGTETTDSEIAQGSFIREGTYDSPVEDSEQGSPATPIFDSHRKPLTKKEMPPTPAKKPNPNSRHPLNPLAQHYAGHDCNNTNNNMSNNGSQYANQYACTPMQASRSQPGFQSAGSNVPRHSLSYYLAGLGGEEQRHVVENGVTIGLSHNVASPSSLQGSSNDRHCEHRSEKIISTGAMNKVKQEGEILEPLPPSAALNGVPEGSGLAQKPGGTAGVCSGRRIQHPGYPPFAENGPQTPIRIETSATCAGGGSPLATFQRENGLDSCQQTPCRMTAAGTTIPAIATTSPQPNRNPFSPFRGANVDTSAIVSASGHSTVLVYEHTTGRVSNAPSQRTTPATYHGGGTLSLDSPDAGATVAPGDLSSAGQPIIGSSSKFPLPRGPVATTSSATGSGGGGNSPAVGMLQPQIQLLAPQSTGASILPANPPASILPANATIQIQVQQPQQQHTFMTATGCSLESDDQAVPHPSMGSDNPTSAEDDTAPSCSSSVYITTGTSGAPVASFRPPTFDPSAVQTVEDSFLLAPPSQRFKYEHALPHSDTDIPLRLHEDVNGTVWLATALVDGLPYAVKQVIANDEGQVQEGGGSDMKRRMHRGPSSGSCYDVDPSSPEQHHEAPARHSRKFPRFSSTLSQRSKKQIIAKCPRTLRSEIEALSLSAKCPFITRYHGSYLDTDTGCYILQTEYCTQGTLTEYALNYRDDYGIPCLPPEREVRRIMEHVYQGLAFLHSNHICHGNLHPVNCFVDSNSMVKIGNFGASRKLKTDHDRSRSLLPLLYEPPTEYTGETPFSRDVYSFAAGLLHLLWRCILARSGEDSSYELSKNFSLSTVVQASQGVYSDGMAAVFEGLLSEPTERPIAQGVVEFLEPCSRLQLELLTAYQRQIAQLKREIAVVKDTEFAVESGSLTVSASTFAINGSPMNRTERCLPENSESIVSPLSTKEEGKLFTALPNSACPPTHPHPGRGSAAQKHQQGSAADTGVCTCMSSSVKEGEDAYNPEATTTAVHATRRCQHSSFHPTSATNQREEDEILASGKRLNMSSDDDDDDDGHKKKESHTTTQEGDQEEPEKEEGEEELMSPTGRYYQRRVSKVVEYFERNNIYFNSRLSQKQHRHMQDQQRELEAEISHVADEAFELLMEKSPYLERSSAPIQC